MSANGDARNARIGSLLSLVLGTYVSNGTGAATNDVAATAAIRALIEERVMVARANIADGQVTSPPKSRSKQMTQWYNWGNWPNNWFNRWGNW